MPNIEEFRTSVTIKRDTAKYRHTALRDASAERRSDMLQYDRGYYLGMEHAYDRVLGMLDDVDVQPERVWREVKE